MRVIIVGAGVSGLSLASFLRRVNIDCVIVDQAPYLSANFQVPTVLQANALSCFKSYGIFGMFEDSRLQPEDYFGIKDAATGEWMLKVKNHEVSLSSLGELDIIPSSTARSSNYNSCTMQRMRDIESYELGKVALRATLNPQRLRKALQEHILDLRVNQRVVDLVPHDGVKGGVHVVFEDGTSEWGDVVVGADGMHSTVRKVLYPNEHIQSTSLNSLQIDGFVNLEDLIDRKVHPNVNPLDALPSFLQDGQPCEMWGNRLTCSMYPLTHQGEPTVSFSAHIYDAPHEILDIGANDNLSGDAYREVYRSVLYDSFKSTNPELASMLKKAAIAVPTEAVEVPIIAQWFNRRAVLVGEAAHGSLPSFLSQDASLCVEDAAMLAAALCNVPVMSDEGFGFAFKQYETVRRDRIEKYIRQSRRARRFCSTPHVGIRNAVLKMTPSPVAVGLQKWLSDWAYSSQQLLVDPKTKFEQAYRR